MNKQFCDRCGKEVKSRSILRPKKLCIHETFLSAEFTMWGNSGRQYDLCYDCYCELKKFMNDPTTYHLDCPETQEGAE